MQRLVLRRAIRSNKATLGKLSLGTELIAHTLENPWLDNETFISCIPTGDYKVKKYSSKKYPDVWELQDVKDRSKILIHNGNLEKHTQGCILVGSAWGFISEELAVLNSKNTLNKLRSILDDEFLLKIII